MANNRTLPYNLETPDAGKKRRKHRSGEVMSNLNKINDGNYVSSSPPAAADRYQGMQWTESGADYTRIWVCDHNLNFTIQLGGDR